MPTMQSGVVCLDDTIGPLKVRKLMGIQVVKNEFSDEMEELSQSE